jgi:DNA-binding PadR family transcriptional regulator
MSLKHALLGFLSVCPATGYELKGVFENSVQHFWNADLSQIYRSLDEIKSEELATVRVEPQAGKPPRHIYYISEKGQEELLRWLREPIKDMPTIRNPLLVKVFFGALVGKEAIMAHLRAYQESIHRRLGAYGKLSDEGFIKLAQEMRGRGELADSGYFEPKLSKEHLLYAKATLKLGMKIAKATDEWCSEIIEELEVEPKLKGKKRK